MSKFAGDSIISGYVNMLDVTQSNQKLPEYSEIYLRLAFKEAYGKNYVLLQDTLQLYRKLLVLYYCEEYSSLKSVIAIMERCFSVEDIHSIIAEQDNLVCKWFELRSSFLKHSNKAQKRKISTLEEYKFIAARFLEKKLNK